MSVGQLELLVTAKGTHKLEDELAAEKVAMNPDAQRRRGFDCEL
jgi:hypothetical protein